MVKHIQSDSEFHTELNNSSGKVIVVDFFATWCGPCRNVAPFYEQLSSKYPQLTFLKLDVDVSPETAAAQAITAMPTFVFYQNGAKVDSLRGANPTELENIVKKWALLSGSAVESPIPGQVDLISMVTKKDCECLNESDSATLRSLLDGNGYLESDCDEQLLILISFNQPVKLHSIQMKGPESKAPKTIKLFINLPNMLDFDTADSVEPAQSLQLDKDALEGKIVNLRYVKFQNVQSLLIFVKDNQGGADTTVVEQLKLFGTPLSGTTDMQQFKRVVGKAGESH